ncbi:hypothetical protein NLX85_18255 [Micromonospora sp. A3M-1-15]|uniref:hypothetical protein n=1 Tax=Micromonospora sp. A3M-1-15 TaxID=2962035 RepID=UPI0020B85DA4|nr:hypothetical protein [Micromonospora sp. A3M-1-15]MCP3785306.1 hypothetical protein [Micromonospora sp. A3M-1-15]
MTDDEVPETVEPGDAEPAGTVEDDEPGTPALADRADQVPPRVPPAADPATPDEPSPSPADQAVGKVKSQPFTNGKGGTAPSAVGAVDDDDRADRVPEQQQSRTAGRETLASASVKRGIVSTGDHSSSVYYETHNVSYAGRQVTVQVSYFGAEYVERESGVYLEVDRFVDMRATLLERHLLVLSGEPGSGRRGTALTLLTRVFCDPRSIGTLEVDDDSIFAVIYDTVSFERGQGFIVERGSRPLLANTLEALRDRAEKRGAYLVVIDGPGAASGEAVYENRRPDSAMVLDRHLRWRLDEHRAIREDPCTLADAERYRNRVEEHWAVRRRLNIAPSVLYIAQLAQHLVQHIHRKEPLDQLISEWDDHPRKLAKEILEIGVERSENPQLVPHQQAFRIAYAVFHGHPLSAVFQAGELLSQKIMPLFEVRDSKPARLIIDGNIEKLIHPTMVGQQPPAAGRMNPRRARLADVGLIHTLLEVAWHDYDTLRGPLQAWLTVLAGSPLVEVQVRAAQITGVLASFDFNEVYRNLIGVWARWQATYRNSAAIAMDMAYSDKGLEKRVLNRIRDWSNSPDPLLQDSAARAYGMGIGEDDVPRAIQELARLGRRPELAASKSVTVAMGTLFLSGAAEEVMDALGAWITAESPHLAHHAVRLLVELARLYGSGGPEGWPALPKLAAESAARQDALVNLWRRALTGSMTSRRAWESMRRWLTAADSDPDLSAFVESMALRVFDGTLAERARFNLTIWSRRQPGADLIPKLLSHLDRARSTPIPS